MAARRLVPLARPITLSLDGVPFSAEAGESVAQALVAADRLLVARSPKLHRPRGPACLVGGCDGCLVRLDGVPNVMSCLVAAEEGMRVETQNVVGSRTTDLLRVTDWFFPNGIDHHHLLAGVPGVSAVMQGIARRVAGLGTLPNAVAHALPSDRRDVDVLVVGTGPAGLAAASRLAALGVDVLCVDDAPLPGGSLRALGANASRAFHEAHPVPRDRVYPSTVAAGIYEPAPSRAPGRREVLLATPAGALVALPRITILATGAHDGAWLVPNNDLPGVFSSRAAALLAASGVSPGERIVVAGADAFTAALAVALGGKVELIPVERAEVEAVLGSSRVGGVSLAGRGKVRADAVVHATPPEPRFELLQQAGGDVRFDGRFVPGAALGDVLVAGEVAGVPFDLEALVASGVAAAERAAGG